MPEERNAKADAFSDSEPPFRSVEKVRALAREEYGELHVGYAPIPAVEILPPWIAAFRKSVPRDLPQPDESRRS
jgi:hypothetical protein